ncbi:hypothetical protein GLOIN_2v1766279 [Rhizophagus clarus]|uniref:Uncharacterized protein n=1 Tax=Rhizophagus clarus TaxID=94130 RepID=A0A8H3LHL6_9GLOM|nr:hypothetical protein GLOIN_2v1766279 [Rhizophagus clarus]
MPANRKRYFTELTSQSQKNKRISMIGKEIATQTLIILKENKFTSPSEEIIASLETIIFKINGEIVELIFHSDNITDFTQYLDSIIRACDKTLISHDSYHRLAKTVPNLIREHVIEKCQNKITKTMNILIPIKLFNIHSINFNDVDNENQQDIDGIEFNDDDVGNGAYQSIFSLLDIIIPILTTSLPPVLKIGDKINIKLSGNRRNVGRKQKHVMLTMCILNEKEAVLSPAHQYSICLYLEKESYDSLSTVSAKFSHELEQLKTNRYKDSNNTIWPDVKIQCFFKKLNNWIIDELHLMLRISDVLFQCLFYELIKKKDFANITQILIIAEMKRLHIYFEFYPPIMKNGKWKWTSLMGPDKEKILKDFQIRHLFDEQQAIRGQDIEHLWHEFYHLYKIMRQKSLIDKEINQFEADAKQ